MSSATSTRSRLVLETQGEDRRGNGTATATTTLTFAENGEQTDIEVSADLELTGKPAQFGEEVIADTLSKLLDQFLSCVAGRFAEGIGDPAEEDFVEDDPEEESDTEQTLDFEAVSELGRVRAGSGTGARRRRSELGRRSARPSLRRRRHRNRPARTATPRPRTPRSPTSRSWPRSLR